MNSLELSLYWICSKSFHRINPWIRAELRFPVHWEHYLIDLSLRSLTLTGWAGIIQYRLQLCEVGTTLSTWQKWSFPHVWKIVMGSCLVIKFHSNLVENCTPVLIWECNIYFSGTIHPDQRLNPFRGTRHLNRCWFSYIRMQYYGMSSPLGPELCPIRWRPYAGLI